MKAIDAVDRSTAIRAAINRAVIDMAISRALLFTSPVFATFRYFNIFTNFNFRGSWFIWRFEFQFLVGLVYAQFY